MLKRLKVKKQCVKKSKSVKDCYNVIPFTAIALTDLPYVAYEKGLHVDDVLLKDSFFLCTHPVHKKISLCTFFLCTFYVLKNLMHISLCTLFSSGIFMHMCIKFCALFSAVK